MIQSQIINLRTYVLLCYFLFYISIYPIIFLAGHTAQDIELRLPTHCFSSLVYQMTYNRFWPSSLKR